MEKIKKSFLKILLIVFIVDTALSLLHMIMLYLPIGVFADLIPAVLSAPLYIGVYRYCFDLIDGKTPEYTELFRFYRETDKCVRAAAAYLLGDFLVYILASMLSGVLILLVILGIGGDENAYAVLCLICFLLLAMSSIFMFTPFIYAVAPEKGLKYAIKGALPIFVKYVLAILVFVFIEAAPLFFGGFWRYALGAVVHLAKIYLVYFIIEKNGGREIKGLTIKKTEDNSKEKGV